MHSFTDAAIAPSTEVNSDRVVDNGELIRSGSISTGVNMLLFVVAKLLGRDQTIETTSYMEYDWREPSSIALH